MSDQAGYQLVHTNIVRPTTGFNARHPTMAFFLQRFQEILPVAKEDEGLRWHDHGGRMPDGTFIGLPELVALDTQSMEENPHVITMAGWKDLSALKAFAYRSHLHADGMKNLRDWVDRSEGPTMVLWWSPRGQKVSVQDGWEKIQQLREDGISDEVFTVRGFKPMPEA